MRFILNNKTVLTSSKRKVQRQEALNQKVKITNEQAAVCNVASNDFSRLSEGMKKGALVLLEH